MFLTQIFMKCRTLASTVTEEEDEESSWVMNLMNKLCQGTTSSKSENQKEEEELKKKAEMSKVQKNMVKFFFNKILFRHI